MTIGIIGAMQQEITLLRQQISDLTESKHGPITFYLGTLAGHKIVLVQSGIGKTAAAMATTLLIDNYSPRLIINTGSAGGYDQNLNIGDLVISSEVRHHDVDVTAFGFEIGQGFGFPAAFIADSTLIGKAKIAAQKQVDIKAKVGLICSGDSFMDCPERVDNARNAFPNMIAVEMEGAAIAQVCQQFDCPFVIIRALSDIAGKSSHQSFESFLEQAAKHSSKLLTDMLTQL